MPKRRFHPRLGALALFALSMLHCQERSAPTLRSLAPRPLPRLTRPAAAAVEVYGESIPTSATRWDLKDADVFVHGAPWDGVLPKGPVLLVPDERTYLVQVAPLLAKLDDGEVETWLLHPSKRVAFRIVLRDESAFGRWLDEPKPGKVRIIQRSDGLELVTNMGKLPGFDPNGPTVPSLAGELDLSLLREGLAKLKERFGSEELCVVPSFGSPLQKTAELLTGNYPAERAPLFKELSLVYPRPRAKPR